MNSKELQIQQTKLVAELTAKVNEMNEKVNQILELLAKGKK